MRKITLLSLAICMTLFAGKTNAADGGYNIKVKIPQLKDSLCYLANYFGDKQYIQDSAKASPTGEIIFKNKKELPGGIYLFVMPSKKYFEMIIDKEQNFSLETDTIDPVGSMQIKGSSDNALFYDYLKFVMSKQKEMGTLDGEMHMAKTKQDSASVKEKMTTVGKSVTDFKTKFMFRTKQTRT